VIKVRFSHYIKDRDEWDTIYCNLYDIEESVIFVDSKSYINSIKKIDPKRLNMTSINDVLMFLNNKFNPKNIYFKIGNDKNKPIIDAYTDKNKNINIVVSEDVFFDKVYNDWQWFIKQFRRILNHELVHRHQYNRVDFSRIKPRYQNLSNPEQYLSNKHEIMAYANSIVNDLMSKEGTPEKALKLLQRPTMGMTKDIDRYFINFELGSKVINQLYKYMYEYLTKWE